MLVDALVSTKTGRTCSYHFRTSPRLGFVDTSVLLGVMLSQIKTLTLSVICTSSIYRRLDDIATSKDRTRLRAITSWSDYPSSVFKAMHESRSKLKYIKM